MLIVGANHCGIFWEIHSQKVKPRELVAKLRSMTETIKMLSTENVALREENDGLVMMRGGTSGTSIAILPPGCLSEYKLLLYKDGGGASCIRLWVRFGALQ